MRPSRFRYWLAALLCLFGSAAASQDLPRWGDLEGFLVQSLAPGQQSAAFAWLTDSDDPSQMREAIGVVYPVIVGAAGNTGIVAGHFTRIEAGFVRDRIITNLFGYDPRDVRYYPDRILITTTVLGPNDPRCCPTVAQVWSISRTTWNAEHAR